jgi:hypothetical protein
MPNGLVSKENPGQILSRSNLSFRISEADRCAFVPFLRLGRFTSMGGEEAEFSRADLKEILAAYDPDILRAPIIVGHDTQGIDDRELYRSPLSYGVVRSLRPHPDNPDILEAEINPCSKTALTWMQDGNVINVSPSFYKPESPINPTPGKRYLRHIALLGTNPPAISGLPEFRFQVSDRPCDFEAFSLDGGFAHFDPIQTPTADFMAGVRSGLIAKRGLKAADRIMPRSLVEKTRLQEERYFLEFQKNQKKGNQITLNSTPPEPNSPNDGDESKISDTTQTNKEAMGEQQKDNQANSDDLQRHLENYQRQLDEITAERDREREARKKAQQQMRRNDAMAFAQRAIENGILSRSALNIETVDFSVEGVPKTENMSVIDFMTSLDDRQLGYFKHLVSKQLSGFAPDLNFAGFDPTVELTQDANRSAATNFSAPDDGGKYTTESNQNYALIQQIARRDNLSFEQAVAKLSTLSQSPSFGRLS